jgi:hypothetical protein
MTDSSAGDTPATLQSDLEGADVAGEAQAVRAAGAPKISDPVALLAHLDASGRFHRDGRLGRVYHRGMVSLRENVSTDSLHVVVHHNRLMAHVDKISPLAERADRQSGYSVRQALAHNRAGMAQDLVGLLRGRQGDHRCELNCTWVAAETADPREEVVLLDPQASASSVQLEARVTASLDEARLRAALAMSLGEPAAGHDPLEVVDCADDDALDAARRRLYAIAVPVTRRPPLQACLARHPAGDVLMLNLNHAATDGVGALAVLRHVASAYADDRDLAALDFLAGSDLPVEPLPPSASFMKRLRTGAVERVSDLRSRPAGIVPDGAQPDEQATDRGGVRTVRRVVEVAHVEGGGDILVAALHLAIDDWNAQHDVPSARISGLVQTDLRPPGWPPATIANLSVTARISSDRRDRSDPASAARAIAARSARNRATRSGIALVAALERAGLLPLWAKQSVVVLQPLTANRHIDSTLLCNLRCPDPPWFGKNAGDTVELWFSPPARGPLTLCVGAVSFAGRLHLTFRYPRRLFDRAAADRFAGCYLEHLRATMSVADRP